MKILLIGKTGQFGGDLLRNVRGHEIYAPGREILDIGSSEAIESAVNDFRPNVVINTAAFHNVPLCEIEFESAFKINCIAVRDLALACKQAEALLITFSSDYVFGGDKRTPYLEGDQPAPLQIYGISRVAGEFAALAAAPDHTIIVRTCGLYGMHGARSKGGNFVDKRIEDAKNHRTLEIGCDQVVSPTYTDDLSRAIARLVDHPELKPGIYHLVNEGQCSWYQFTKAIYELMKIDTVLKAVDRGGMTGSMRRPLFSVLANTRAKEMGVKLPPWRDALERYLKDKYGKLGE